MAKQKVTLEVLSYHATAPIEEAEALTVRTLQSTNFKAWSSRSLVLEYNIDQCSNSGLL